MAEIEERVFKKMIDRSEEAFLIYSLEEKRFIYANDSFEVITKRSRQQLFENPASMLEAIVADDHESALKVITHLPNKRSNTVLDFRILHPDNTERWLRLKIYPVFTGEKMEFLAGTMEDDTGRKAGILNMQKVNGWKDSVLEILAHDLRGPIGIVQMLASSIAQQLKRNEINNIQQWIRTIEEVAIRSINLIQSVIKKESLDSAGVELDRERIDLVWEIGEVMKIYQDTKEKMNRQYEYTHSHDKIFADVDSMKFLQIINNLVSNAVKFTRDNGEIKVHIEKLEKTALITVSDNGIGIPRSLQPILFNKYTAAARTGLDGQESIGLGMWIIKTFTEIHGGRVWLESEENKGTRIYLELPLGEVEALPLEP